jgi:hypothetical protein
MHTQIKRLIKASALSVCMVAVIPNVFAESVTDAPRASDDPQVGLSPQVVTSDELQTRLLNTLDNAQGIAAGIGMTSILGDQIEAARASVLAATPQELEAIPPNLFNSLSILEAGSGQMRMIYDPELQPKGSNKSKSDQASQISKIQSSGASSGGANYDDTALDAPGYPGQDWSFSFEAGEPDGDPEDPDSGSGESHGTCHAPGSTYPARVAALNSAIVANAINDIADHFCEFVVLGFNVAPLCVVTEVIAAITVGIDENMSLCNEHIGAAEVSATWEGLKTVHENVQHVHDDLADVESDLASHDTDIKSQINTHDTDIKSQVTNHDTDIKSQVTIHDTQIKSQVSIHDTDMKLQLATHDTDIKARLGEIQGTVDENQRLISITMARQLEILRLLLTPSGQRELNPDVLSCTGSDCPPVTEVLSCKNGLKWPCK